MNRGYLLTFFLLAALLLTACGKSDDKTTAPAAARKASLATEASAATRKPLPAPFRITDVHTDRERFNPQQGQRVGITYTIDQDAEVALHIYDGRDVLIYRSNPVETIAGQHQLSWNGTDASGEIVPPEAYSYVLVATNSKGKVIHDLTDVTGSEALIVADPVWDAAAGSITLSPGSPCARQHSVRSDRRSLICAPLVDWVPREAGDQVEAWDGWDASKVVNLAKHPMLSSTVRAYTLPNNTIFVGPNPAEVRFVSAPALGKPAPSR